VTRDVLGAGVAVAEPPAEPGQWMALSEAASRLGWHLPRVQSRSRREEWPKRRGNRGQAMEHLVPASLLAEPDAAGHRHDAADGVAETEALTELRDELAEARAESAAAKGELAPELRRSQDLATALSKAEARAERLEAELADIRRRAGAELAEARRPWLARVLEGLRRKG
jgi:hypothetical protein